MSGISLIATCRQSYQGRLLKEGDAFDAVTQLEADDLIAVNMARPVKIAIAIPQHSIKTRDLNAATDQTEEGTGVEVAASDEHVATTLTEKSTYSRRDLRAKR